MKTTILFFCFFATISIAVSEDVYLKSGVSAPSREWRAADYRTLVTLITEKKVPLPDLGTEAGANVLNRVCSVQNLAYGRNKTLPLAARMQDLMEMQPALTALGKIYASEALKGGKVGNESALLVGFMLDFTSLQIDLVEEFIPTIKRDSGYEFRMQALKEMRGGLAIEFVGTLSAVSEDKLYSDKNRSDLLAAIARNASHFARVLESDVRAEMILKFTKLKEKMKEPHDQASITTVLSALNSEHAAASDSNKPSN